MAHVLCTTFPASSHVLFMAPFARSLAKAGHRVTITAAPALADLVERATGLDPVTVGSDAAIGEATTSPPSPDTLDAMSGLSTAGREDLREQRGFLLGALAMSLGTGTDAILRSTTTDQVDLARRLGPDMVLWDAFAFGGSVSAAASGAESVRLSIGGDYGRLLRARFVQDTAPGGFDLVRALFAEAPGAGSLDLDTLLFGRRTIDPWPDALRSARPDHLAVRARCNPVTDAPPPSEDRRRSSGPRIAVSLGLSGTEVWGHLPTDLEDLLRRLVALGAEVLVTVPPSTLPADLRGSRTHAVGFVDLEGLFSRCDAAVHNGGLGTVLAAVDTATPQVVVPTGFWDERDLARHLADAGAGLSVEAPPAPVAEIAEAALSAAECPGMRRAAVDLRRSFSTAPPVEDLPDLLGLTPPSGRPSTPSSSVNHPIG